MSQAIVAAIRSQYPTPLGAGHPAFLLEVAAALKLGLFKKNGGTVIRLPDGTTVSQDTVMARDGRTWDILHDGEGSADPVFNQSGVEPDVEGHYYAVSASDPKPSDPQPTGDLAAKFAQFDQDVRAAIGRIEGQLKILTETLPPPASVFPPFPKYQAHVESKIPYVGTVKQDFTLSPKEP